MTRRRAALCLAGGLALVLTGCPRKGEPEGAARVTPGDAVWFLEGIGPGEDVSGTLTTAGFTRLFLPAGRLTQSAEGWSLTGAAPPSSSTGGLSVHLVYSIDGLTGRWKLEAEGGFDRIAEAIAAGVRQAIDSKAWGTVAGVHVDAPIPQDSAEQGIALLARIRAKLPESLLLSGTLGQISDPAKASAAFAAAPVDAVYATVFGTGALDPTVLEGLSRPWWAGYDPASAGFRNPAAGGSREPVGEGVFSRLTDDPRVEIGHDISLSEVAASGFVFRFRQPVTVGSLRFSPGDQVIFRQPAMTELLYRLGADSANKRHLRGRVLLLSGAAESDRLITLAALSDMLLGRPLDPNLVVTIASDYASASVGAENVSAHASLVSRTGNWIEIDVPTGGIADVEPGGFDRFEVFDAAGQAVALARATRVRLFETLLSPREAIAPARISLRNPPPVDCCAQRSQVLSAAGPEMKTDWLAPTPVPTRTPKPKTGRR